MENAWNPELQEKQSGSEYGNFAEDLAALHRLFGKRGSKLGSYTLHRIDRARVETRGGASIPLAHGSFDDDKHVVETTIQRILAAR